MSRLLTLVLAGVLLAGCGGDDGPAVSTVEEAHELCMGVGEMDDDMLTVILRPDTDDSVDGLGCVLDALGASDDMYDGLVESVGTPGPHESEWDGFAATWGFTDDYEAMVVVISRSR